MSRIGRWIRDDLRKVNRPREITRTVRRYPRILLWAVVHFVVALVVIYAVLAVLGHADSFGDFWAGAAVWAGGAAGRMISERKSTVAPPDEES